MDSVDNKTSSNVSSSFSKDHTSQMFAHQLTGQITSELLANNIPLDDIEACMRDMEEQERELGLDYNWDEMDDPYVEQHMNLRDDEPSDVESDEDDDSETVASVTVTSEKYSEYFSKKAS